MAKRMTTVPLDSLDAIEREEVLMVRDAALRHAVALVAPLVTDNPYHDVQNTWPTVRETAELVEHWLTRAVEQVEPLEPERQPCGAYAISDPCVRTDEHSGMGKSVSQWHERADGSRFATHHLRMDVDLVNRCSCGKPFPHEGMA